MAGGIYGDVWRVKFEVVHRALHNYGCTSLVFAGIGIASLLLSQLARMLIFINAYYIIADALCASLSFLT